MSETGIASDRHADAARWDLVITPHRGWFDIDIAGVWKYRDLVRLLVHRDFVAFYKQTILGPLWYVIQPLLTTIVFVVIFHRIARIPTEGVPPFLFYMAGIVPWTYFLQCVSKTSDIFTTNAGIFGKVYFPRLVVPVATVLTNLITFGIQLALFLCIYWYFHAPDAGFHPNAWLVALPLLIVQSAVLGLSIGIISSALTAKYRDLTLLIGFGMQLWMYSTPIVYPLSQVPEGWRWAFALNPMTAIVETFRHAFFGTGAVDRGMHGIGLAVTLVLLFVGLALFSRVERWSMDTV